MAKTVLSLTIVTEDNPEQVQDILFTRAIDYNTFVQKFLAWFPSPGVRGGKIVRALDKSTDGVSDKAGDAASITYTVAANGTLSGDTFTLGSVTLTWDTDMDVGADADESATNLAAEINGNATLTGVFTATAASNVVTITAYGPPLLLKNLTASVSDASATLSATNFGHDTTDTVLEAGSILKQGIA